MSQASEASSAKDPGASNASNTSEDANTLEDSVADQLSSQPALAREPTSGERTWNQSLRVATLTLAGVVLALVLLLLVTMTWQSIPAIIEGGFSMLVSLEWNPPQDKFGLLPSLVGTITSSALALVIGGVLGIAVAIFLTQDFLSPTVSLVLRNIVDLLAAVPSVVYGLWGLAVIIPLVNPLANFLNDNFGWFPLFGTKLSATGGLFPAALVLAIMILPTISAVSRDALDSVPRKIKEAAYGMGCTRWQTIFGVLLPTASGGILGALILGLGRALGETMALAMLMGNVKSGLSWSLFAPGTTLAALIANSYAEATDFASQLVYAGLVLLAITLLVNMLGSYVIHITQLRFKGER